MSEHMDGEPVNGSADVVAQPGKPYGISSEEADQFWGVVNELRDQISKLGLRLPPTSNVTEGGCLHGPAWGGGLLLDKVEVDIDEETLAIRRVAKRLSKLPRASQLPHSQYGP